MLRWGPLGTEGVIWGRCTTGTCRGDGGHEFLPHTRRFTTAEGSGAVHAAA